MTKEQEIILKINELNFLLTGEAKEKYSPVLQEVLNILKEKDAEIEKKDKQIDLMARAIDNYDSQLVINTFKDKEHVKQYFKRRAKLC